MAEASKADSVQPPRGRPCDPHLDRVILASAADELAAVGYARVTMAAVAKRAGASTASLYRRWPSKGALIGAAATRLATEALVEVDTGSLRGDLRGILLHKLDAVGGARGTALQSLVGQCAHDPDLARIVQESVFDVTRRHVREALARAAARGGDDTGTDPDVLATLVIGLVLDGLSERDTSGRTVTPLPADVRRARALAALDIVLDGCGMSAE